MKSGVAVGGEQQAPAYQRKEYPIIVGRIEQINDDQERIHGDIDEEMNEKAPLSLVGDDRFAPPGPLTSELQRLPNSCTFWLHLHLERLGAYVRSDPPLGQRSDVDQTGRHTSGPDARCLAAAQLPA